MFRRGRVGESKGRRGKGEKERKEEKENWRDERV